MGRDKDEYTKLWGALQDISNRLCDVDKKLRTHAILHKEQQAFRVSSKPQRWVCDECEAHCETGRDLEWRDKEWCPWKRLYCSNWKPTPEDHHAEGHDA